MEDNCVFLHSVAELGMSGAIKVCTCKEMMVYTSVHHAHSAITKEIRVVPKDESSK